MGLFYIVEYQQLYTPCSKVKLGRVTDYPPRSPSAAPSPVASLAHKASSLSLDSPSANTRGGGARKAVPKPVAFTVEAPKPGNAQRRQTLATTRLSKQPCQVKIKGCILCKMIWLCGEGGGCGTKKGRILHHNGIKCL